MEIGSYDIIIEHDKTISLDEVFTIIQKLWINAVREFDDISNEMFVYKSPESKKEWDIDFSNEDMIYVINQPNSLTLVIGGSPSEREVCNLIKSDLGVK